VSTGAMDVVNETAQTAGAGRGAPSR
jgi:hypothetical protein